MLTQLHQDIERAWSDATPWPRGLAPEDAAEVRTLVRTATEAALRIFDQLDAASPTAEAAANWTPRTAAFTLWERSFELTGDNGWKRVTIWTALAVNYLTRVADAGWPAPLGEWLRDTDAAFQRGLSSAIGGDVRAASASLAPLRGTTSSAMLTRPDVPPPPPMKPGALAEIERRTVFRGSPERFREAGGGGAAAARPPSAAPSVATPTRAQPPDEGARRYDVWFGTNRAIRDLTVPAKAFTNERDPEGRVHYGTCSVDIPRTHKFGSTGTAWWKRWARFDFHDDRVRLAEILSFDSDKQFFTELRGQMEELGQADRQALVYIHGYNVSFEDAAVRAAQIGFDLKVRGVTAFFSWPSANDVKGYFADQDRIEASENEIAEFLIRMSNESGAQAVHILAHSMGNRGLARAVQRITARAAREGAVRFGQIILAAPDISVELFRDLAAVYPTLSTRTTMYASAKDHALSLSGYLHDGFRAGFTPPITVVAGVDTIEVTDIDLTMLGHGYYAAAEAVLYDMSQLLQSDAEPALRPRLRADRCDGGAFWKIGK